MIWRSYKAVLWDFDGVIVDTEWPIYETWREIFENESQELTLDTYVQCIGSDFETWSPEAHLESLTGRTYDWEQIGIDRNVEIRRRLENAQLNPGILDALTAMRAAGLKLAVVSSSSHSWVDHWLDQLAVRNLFDAVVCRGDAPKIKPAPDLYIEGAEQLSLAPKDCLVIEDSLNGLKAAQAAGCDCIAVPNRITKVIDFSAAKAVLDDFHALLM